MAPVSQELEPPAISGRFKALIGQRPGDDADTHLHLWPYLKGNGEHAEPDVVLRIDNSDGDFDYWIVEVKWGASLGENQVGREIRTVRNGECRRGGLVDGPRKVIGYTLIGAISRHATAMAEARREFGQGLNIYDFAWPSVTERLRNLATNSAVDPGLVAWATLAANFLDGQPEGSVLGRWPDMLMSPLAREFSFDTDERFGFASELAPVSPCHFNFSEDP